MDEFGKGLEEAKRAREELRKEVMGEIRRTEEEGKAKSKDILQNYKDQLRDSYTADSAQLETAIQDSATRKQQITEYIQRITAMQNRLKAAQGEQRKMKNESQTLIQGLKRSIGAVREKGAKAAADVARLATDLRNKVQSEMEGQRKLFQEAANDARESMRNIQDKVR